MRYHRDFVDLFELEVLGSNPYIEIWKGKNDVDGVDDGLYTFLMILKHSVFRDGRNDVVVLGGRRKKLINET